MDTLWWVPQMWSRKTGAEVTLLLKTFTKIETNHFTDTTEVLRLKVSTLFCRTFKEWCPQYHLHHLLVHFLDYDQPRNTR